MSDIIEPAVDAGGYRLVAGYRVRDTNWNGRAAVEIVVSPTKRIVVQPLKMSEQLDLFEILSASENPIYRNLASMAASVRALGSQPIGTPVAPRLFPKSSADLKTMLDDLDDDGVLAILSVREAPADAAAKPEDVAKNLVGTPA